MGLFEFIGMKKKDLSLDQVKREEIKLGIRESQTLSKLEKLEKEREDIFAKGMKIKSPPRRRQLARLYEMKSSGVKMMERELGVLSKEITTIAALKLALERRQTSKEGVSRILERVDEAKLMTYLEDDKISQEQQREELGPPHGEHGVIQTERLPVAQTLAGDVEAAVAVQQPDIARLGYDAPKSQVPVFVADDRLCGHVVLLRRLNPHLMRQSGLMTLICSTGEGAHCGRVDGLRYT